MSNVVGPQIKVGWRARLGLGIDQIIPPAALENVLPPPPGMPKPRPHMRVHFPTIAAVCIIIGILPFVYEPINQVLPSGPAAIYIIWGVGIGLTVLIVAQWKIQHRAIHNGVQTVATVVYGDWQPGESEDPNFHDSITPMFVGFNTASWGTITLCAQWVGNDGVAYYFHTAARRGRWSKNKDWYGKRVRLYIDRDNPHWYYLDDVPIPEQELPDFVPPVLPPSVPVTAQAVKQAWKRSFITIIVIVAVIILLCVVPSIIAFLRYINT